ncbi:MAG: hypothetical protein ACM65L_11365 [Microcoleus sp.]
MATTQTIVMFLATPLLVTFMSQEAMGFSLSFVAKGARDLYLPTQSVTYMQGNEEITINTRLDPYKITEMPRGGTITLQNLLEAYRISAYNNSGRTQIWNFTKADKDLRGNVEVLNYYACTFNIPCKYPNLPNVTTPNPPVSTGVGAGIELNYRRGRGDTTRDLRWIQWVNTNHPAHVKQHDNKVSKYLDNVGRENTPFYPGSTERLADRSYREDPLNEHYWIAEAYLADIETFSRKDKNQLTITETNVRIYNGIRWGWKNKVTRRRKQPVPVPVPVPIPTPKPIPFPIPIPSIPKIPNLGEPVASSASGGGGIGYVAVSPSPTPRPIPSPTPSPTPRPIPSPTPRPSPSPTPWTSTPWTSTPWTSTPWTSTPWTSTPWVTSPLGSTSSTVVVSTSTTITSSSPLPKPSSPASSPGGRPIQAVPLSAISKSNAANLRSSSLFESSSKANTDYLAAISSDLLEDSELSSTDSSLNNANLAGVSRDLLEDSELSLTDNNENQVNLADISSNLLEDSELSSTDSNEKQVNLAGVSRDLLEDPELSSTDNNENNVDIGSISADLLQDPELSSEDNNSDAVDLAGISADLLEDPELSYLDDTLTATTPKVSAQNTDDDALSAEAVPEPTTGLGTLFALAILPVIKRLTNRKNQE